MRAAELEALFRAGLQDMKRGDWAAGARAFERVLAADPVHLGALVSRGSALMRLGRMDEAEALYRRALNVHPRQPLAQRNLGVLLDRQERHDEALALADEALAAQPDHAEALFTRGNALLALGRFEEAEAAYLGIANHDEIASDALSKLGVVAAGLGRRDAAVTYLDRALALRTDDALIRFRRSVLRLQGGDFAGGWDDYEARWQVESHLAQSAGVVSQQMISRLETALTPADLAGRRLLLVGEQGVGDQIMFASMIPDAAADAARVVCVCEPRLVGLFSASFPDVVFAGPAQAAIRPSEVDRIVAMGSLGRLYRSRAEHFPGAPYLKARAEVIARWAERLGPRPPGLRIGVSWRGGTPATRRNTRSLSLGDLAPVLALPGCEYVNLQYGDVSAELAASTTPIHAFPAVEIDDFEDLAGLVSNLDLVVSVQTSLVHLCGSIGATCLTLVPHVAEWRYGASGSSTPWYRSVQLFRQPRPGDWASPLRQVADALTARLSAGASG